LVTRVLLQHSRRMSKRRISSPFHEMYGALISDLVLLGTSRYAKVRQQSQTTLFSAMAVFSQAKQSVIPKVMDLISVPADEMEAKHQQLKGALHILAHRSVARAINSDYSFIQTFIETVPRLHCNNKPSIQDLVSRAFSSLRQEFRTRNLDLKISDLCFEAVCSLEPAATEKAAYFQGSALQRSAKHHSEVAAKFDSLVEQLISTLNNDSHNWRFELMLAGILLALLREDRDIPRLVIVYFFRNLANDMIHIRSQAARAANVIIAMCKTRPVKSQLLLNASSSSPNTLAFIDDVPPEAEHSTGSSTPAILLVSSTMREQGHVFSVDKAVRPATKDAFEQVILVDKNYIGWNGWPEKMMTYTPAHLQPDLEDPICNDWIEEILEEDGFVDKWMAYASQSRADGSALGFSDCRAELFKGLARNHGIKVLDYFKAAAVQLLEICATDGTGERASKHRCAAEIVAGIVRGAKHWPYDDCQALWAWVMPLLEKNLAEVTNLNIHDWSCAIRFCVYDRDPRRFYQLTDMLFKTTLTMNEDDTAFAQHRKLYFLHTALEELSWRGQQASAALLSELTPFVSHPYKLVREKIARCLFVALRAFWNPYQSSDAAKTHNEGTDAASPIRGFVTDMAASFAAARAASETTAGNSKKKQMTNCYKTVLTWISTSFHDGSAAALVPHLHVLLPQLFSVPEMDPEDDELAALCFTALGHASQAVLPKSHMGAYLNATLDATSDTSWHARRRALIFLQVLSFRNLYLIPRERVVEAVISLVKDEQLEVRELAAVTLSGMIRCGIASTGLKEEFILMAKTKIRKVRRRKAGKDGSTAKPLTAEEKAAVIRRHAGVLGLYALITANPYSIPDWMPSALVLVSDCINDPEPIKASVKKTVSEFWRTHQDNKQAIREAFTEDEYDVLSELVIGYNYYA